ncbi:MAG: cysteine hydrolase [Candidatus Woesearchaeota archaeon]
MKKDELCELVCRYMDENSITCKEAAERGYRKLGYEKPENCGGYISNIKNWRVISNPDITNCNQALRILFHHTLKLSHLLYHGLNVPVNHEIIERIKALRFMVPIKGKDQQEVGLDEIFQYPPKRAYSRTMTFEKDIERITGIKTTTRKADTKQKDNKKEKIQARVRKLVNRFQSQTALLIIGMQYDLCHENGKLAQQGANLSKIQAMAFRLCHYIERAREERYHIIYSIQVGYPGITLENHLQLARDGNIQLICSPKTKGVELYIVKPIDDEEIIEIRTFDPFSEPRLEEYLNANDIKRLIIAGVNTEVAVESAVRTANRKGYEVLIPSDLVASNNQEQHILAFERFKYFGTITTSEDIR